MSKHWIIAIEMLLSFGLIIGWCMWELHKLKRERSAEEGEKTREFQD